MSLILKGIDLPKGTDGLSITFHSQDGVTETHILDATQAIQIPKPHGRLIDADKVFCYNFWDEQNIDNAPTILEAEEADENQI